MAVLARFAWLLMVFLVAAGCRMGPGQWGPFRGRIVDAETGAPLAGAHFMVIWERDNPNPVHWTQSFYDAQEAVTDANGRFEIPRTRRFFTLLVARPRFDAFAPGYAAESQEVTPHTGQLYVDDTILKMRLLKTVEERCRILPGTPGREASAKAPLFRASVLRYRDSLSCA